MVDSNNDNRAVLFPPIGVAHVTSRLPELVATRLGSNRSIRIACSVQPNGPPHIGTTLTLASAFSLARRLEEDLGVEVAVTIDYLDNAPRRKLEAEGVVYTISYADDAVGAGELGDYILAYQLLLDDLKSVSGVAYETRSYRELQADETFRLGILYMLENRDRIAPVLSPKDGRLRIRFPCPTCSFMDKEAAATTVDLQSPTAATVAINCPSHGIQKMEFAAKHGAVVDANVPVRTVLRAMEAMNRRNSHETETVMLESSDWDAVWVQRILLDGLSAMEVNVDAAPLHLSSPLIVDWSGAKLSKSQYVQRNAYSDLPDCVLDYRQLEGGAMRVWPEVERWTSEPARFFRSYSIEYILREILDM